MYRIPHLLTLQAVTRTGSFAIAARELDYTPSAVSQQMATLERDTGLVLFEREAHAVRATAAAYRLVELSRGLLAGVDELEQQIRQLATGRIGRVRLGSFPTASERVVPRVLTGFAQRRPDVDVTLQEGEPDELAELVADGELDVALLYEYGLCPRTWPDSLVTTPLLREDLLLLRPAGQDGPPDLSRLAGHRWITSADGTAGATSSTRLCASAGFAPNVTYRSNNYDVVRELVVASSGVAVVPALGHRPDPRITAVRLPQAGAHRTVLVAHRNQNPHPLLAELLAETRRGVPVSGDVTDLHG